MFASDGVDRHFYELCALAELRDRLRAGDIWVTGSLQYRDFESYLIPTATFKVMQKEPLPLDDDTHLPSYLGSKPKPPKIPSPQLQLIDLDAIVAELAVRLI